MHRLSATRVQPHEPLVRNDLLYGLLPGPSVPRGLRERMHYPDLTSISATCCSPSTHHSIPEEEGQR